MTYTLDIPEKLYQQLEDLMQLRGLSNIEQLLELWQAREYKIYQRQRAIHRIDELRERLYATYGDMPDSVNLIREDRER